MDRAKAACTLHGVAQQVSELAKMIEDPNNDLHVLEHIRAVQVQLEQVKGTMLEEYLLECAGGAAAAGDCEAAIDSLREAIRSACTYLSAPHWRELDGAIIPDPQHVL